jgi:hypothetical protein
MESDKYLMSNMYYHNLDDMYDLEKLNHFLLKFWVTFYIEGILFKDLMCALFEKFYVCLRVYNLFSQLLNL